MSKNQLNYQHLVLTPTRKFRLSTIRLLRLHYIHDTYVQILFSKSNSHRSVSSKIYLIFIMF